MEPNVERAARHLAAIRLLNQAICESVAAAGDLGCPMGLLFAPLSDKISLPAFETIIDRLVAGGLLRRSGDLLWAIPQPAPIPAGGETAAILESLSVQRRRAIQGANRA